MLKITVVLLTVISLVLGRDLPSYLKRCSLSDPKLQECMIRHGQEGIPHFIRGDKEYNVPNLIPLKIDKVNFNAGTLRIKFSDMKISGLENAKVVASGVDLKNQKIYFDLIIPKVVINAQYKTNGRILLLPFEGNGPVEIILHDGRYNCTITLNNFSPDSKEPLSYKSSFVKFYVQDSHYQFDNLFNGNKQLGDNINQVLNENHENLNSEFNGVFAETINTVIKAIMSGVVKDIYFSSLFDP